MPQLEERVYRQLAARFAEAMKDAAGRDFAKGVLLRCEFKLGLMLTLFVEAYLNGLELGVL